MEQDGLFKCKRYGFMIQPGNNLKMAREIERDNASSRDFKEQQQCTTHLTQFVRDFNVLYCLNFCFFVRVFPYN